MSVKNKEKAIQNAEMILSDLKTEDFEILEGIKINGKNILDRSITYYMDGMKKKNTAVFARVDHETYKIVKLIGGNNITNGLVTIIDYFIENNPQIKKLSVINNNK